ncbi:MAG: nucleolar RNA-binding Nop10p family protein [Candidatus Woesearchaeota archaeon]
MAHILKCESCGNYSINDVCSCGMKRQKVAPAKYSPEDKYAEYRRKARKEDLLNEEILKKENAINKE